MTSTPSAAELIDAANNATTTEELDQIEAEANGRVTVLDAVQQRRDELAAEPGAPLQAGQPVVIEPAPTPMTGEAAPPAETAEPGEPVSTGPLQPPVVESLAEQVNRESHTVVESSDPTDVVPNRPNIRPPMTQTADQYQEAVDAQPSPGGPGQPVVTTESDAREADNSNPLTAPTNPAPGAPA